MEITENMDMPTGKAAEHSSNLQIVQDHKMFPSYLLLLDTQVTLI